jgi:hypothetical protein
MNELTPIEIGLAGYMRGWHESLIGTTAFMEEYAARDLATSIAWVPGRMVDKVEDMLKAWRQNDNTAAPGLSSKLPVTFIGLARDYMPVLPEFSVATPETPFHFPEDELKRVYHCSTVCNEHKGQAVFIAPERNTAFSMLVQFHTWQTQGPAGRRFSAEYEFAGFKTRWPCVLEAIDPGAVSTELDQTNLCVLVADLTIRATVPTFRAPGANRPNDGKLAPAGYPVVLDIEAQATLAGALGTNPGTHISTTLDADDAIVQVRS